MKNLKQISAVTLGVVLTAVAATAYANNDGSGHNWMPNQPTNNYWQAPSWSGFNNGPGFNSPRFSSNPGFNNPGFSNPSFNNNMPPMYNAAPQQRQVQPNQQAQNRQPNQPPVAPPGYRPPGPYNNQAPNAYRGNQSPPNYRPYPPQRAPNPNMQPNMRQNTGPSAFNTPGYNPYRNNRGNRMPWGGNNNRFGNNKFWGNSGPSKWMNPSKDNWENSWDDMINAPSRMGDMPGGWTAPEVTMPNPIDIGDQFQDNLKDLPDQMRDGQIGNDVSN